MALDFHNTEDQERQRLVRELRLIGGCVSRLRILELLNDETLNVNALAETLGLKQPTISHHLKWLRDAKIIDYHVGHRRRHEYYVRNREIVRRTLHETRLRLNAAY